MSDNFYSYMYGVNTAAEKSVTDEAPKGKEEGLEKKDGCKCEGCDCDKSVKDALTEFLGEEEEEDTPKGEEVKETAMVSEDKKS